MLKSIRYRCPHEETPHLGLLSGDRVYDVTRQVRDWNDPLPMWYTLRALGVSAEDAVQALSQVEPLSFTQLAEQGRLLPPVVTQEVWASGVTYERSREARNAETKIEDSVYDRVYVADRPELFFKATAMRVVPPGQPLGLRSDSSWMVPEPELTLILSKAGNIVGWTIGNDLSSRDIEGENPLYLPQAKMFSRSCSLGPVLLWHTGDEGSPENWTIHLDIERVGQSIYSQSVSFHQFRRNFENLIDYLRRDNPIPDGSALMTGTGIVPPDDFTLYPGDVVCVSIDHLGTLRNPIIGPSMV